MMTWRSVVGRSRSPTSSTRRMGRAGRLGLGRKTTPAHTAAICAGALIRGDGEEEHGSDGCGLVDTDMRALERAPIKHVCMHVCMYVCVHVCMYVCVRVCVCMYVCVYVCMYVCVHVCMCSYFL